VALAQGNYEIQVYGSETQDPGSEGDGGSLAVDGKITGLHLA
jgi:hypothetical protein